MSFAHARRMVAAAVPGFVVDDAVLGPKADAVSIQLNPT
jgi:hypothetical protein